MNKYFVIGIILLTIGISISPAITAVYTDINKTNDESIENLNETKSSDKYTEIFTFIWASTDEFGELKYTETGEGFFRHVEIWLDSGGAVFTGIVREFPWFVRNVGWSQHIIAPHCHIIFYNPGPYGVHMLSAVAIGNIDR